MKFIKLTEIMRFDNNKRKAITLNTRYIRIIQASASGSTMIEINEGGLVYVVETYEQINELLEAK